MKPVSTEVLISRIVDRVDHTDDWGELDRAAADDPTVWQRVVESLRCECALRDAGASLLGSAEAVEAPVSGSRRSVPWGMVTAVVAGLVLGIFLGSQLLGGPAPRSVAPVTAGTTGSDNKRPLVRVSNTAQELSPLVLKTRPAPDGQGYEVLYLRRFVERDVVPTLMAIGRDEHGRPMLQPASFEVTDVTSL